VASFSELSVVQKPVIDLLVENGWTHIPGSALQRDRTASIVEPEVRAALIRLNPLIAAKPDRADEVLLQLRRTLGQTRDKGLVQANKDLLPWLRGLHTIQFTDHDVHEPIRFIDFDDLATNTFVISDEVTFGPIGDSCRFDIVLWVNGLPLIVGEAKSMTDSALSWFNGAKDIHDNYEKGHPEFFAANVLSFATDGRELEYGAVGRDPSEWAAWGSTDSRATLGGWERVKLSIESLLNPTTVLRILSDYVLFESDDRDGKTVLSKIVPRYPQYEAVEAIYNRVLEGKKKRGLVFHTQGSGKTLAMAYAAVKLMRSPKLKNPTLVLIADRVQLVQQTYDQFRVTGMPALAVAKSTGELREFLATDQRGAIFTTVHKFNGAGLLNKRDNIIVLIDEAHRTQEGSLGQQLRAALPNASFYGFTGTPIADADRNTYTLFGDPDDPGHALNTYDSDRSIADGMTVPMHVSARLVKFNIDKEALEAEFQALALAENLDDADKEVLASKLGRLSTFVANPERIRAVCQDIVDYFYATIDPLGMKAQIVVYDRAMCAAYSDELQRLLAERAAARDEPADEVAVVMHVTGKGDEDLARFKLSDSAEERILNRFRSVHDPLKFIIVTSKLGTGFNAPIEGVLFLDRPLKLHTLFQTITRTNRTWKNPDTGQEKQYGLVVDYFGLGEGFARAMLPADPDRKQREIETDGLLDVFEDELASILERFAGIDRSAGDFASFGEGRRRLPDATAVERFAAKYGIVSGIWEALYPEMRLEKHKDDYVWLTKIYNGMSDRDLSATRIWRKLGAKTLALVHNNITDIEVSDPGFNAVLADEETINRLREKGLIGPDVNPDNLAKTAAQTVDDIATRIKRRMAGPAGGHPIYRSLADRLEKLREAQLMRSSDSIDYLHEIFVLARDLTLAERVEEEAGVEGLNLLPDPRVGALTQIFEEYVPADAPVILGNVVRSIDDIVTDVRYDGWHKDRQGDKLVRIEIRRVLRGYGLPMTGELFDRAYAYIAANY
jgi:type I restriction enzyme R subunit